MITKKNYSKNLNKHTKLKLLNKAKKSDNKTQTKNIKYVKKQKHTQKHTQKQKAGGIIWGSNLVKIAYPGLLFDTTATPNLSNAKTIKFEKILDYPKISFSKNGNYVVYAYLQDKLIWIRQYIRKHMFNLGIDINDIRTLNRASLKDLQKRIIGDVVYNVKYSVYELGDFRGKITQIQAEQILRSGQSSSLFRNNKSIQLKHIDKYFFQVKIHGEAKKNGYYGEEKKNEYYRY
jgi:hypothetical protein